MSLSQAELYKVHVRNLTAVTSGLEHIERQLNSAIGSSDEGTTRTLTRIFLLLAGAWAECRLKKVLYEPSGFAHTDRLAVESQGSQLERWLRALELGYRKRYDVRRAELSERSLPMTAWLQYQSLKLRINDDLRPIIEMRNALAHGQWERALNNSETEHSTSMNAALRAENALTVKFRLNLARHLADLIHDLIAASSFERDFDKHYRCVIDVHNRITRQSFQNWKALIVAKFERGRRRRIAQFLRAAQQPDLEGEGQS